MSVGGGGGGGELVFFEFVFVFVEFSLVETVGKIQEAEKKASAQEDEEDRGPMVIPSVSNREYSLCNWRYWSTTRKMESS